MTATYWEMGRRIVEFEQGGEKRAAYGKQLIQRLSHDLSARFGRGFGVDYLELFRAFYLAYPPARVGHGAPGNSETLIRKSEPGPPDDENSESLIRKSSPAELLRRFPLPWTHYVHLIRRTTSAEARRFYEAEAVRGGWSVRQLDRQIASQFYERTGISKNKAAMLGRGSKSRPGDAVSADDEVRDPLVLEFLGLKDEYSESDLEEALVRHVEAFLLELGGDFAFIGRQRRLRIGDEWYRIDLLFFHRGLRCLIVIDLKVGKFTHADRWYGQGLFVREARLGTDMGASRVYSAQPGDFVCNRLLAWEDSFAVAGTESLGALPGAGHRPRTPAPSP
jgi:predicted nuclease of restriction endonuclease-like (RecB) superfamily